MTGKAEREKQISTGIVLASLDNDAPLSEFARLMYQRYIDGEIGLAEAVEIISRHYDDKGESI